MVESAIHWLLGVLALPKVGLSSVFLISFISATLLPLGSEPAVFAVIKANPELYWPTIMVATQGNTLGGVVDYWMGYGAKQVFAAERETAWYRWLRHFGATTMLLSWLPHMRDPIRTLSRRLNLRFWPSMPLMAI